MLFLCGLYSANIVLIGNITGQIIGFDVIPQAAEEIDVPYKKIGKIMLLSIFLAVAWYLLIIFAVCYIMPQSAIVGEMNSQNGLVSAKAIEIAFRSPLMGKVLII